MGLYLVIFDGRKEIDGLKWATTRTSQSSETPCSTGSNPTDAVRGFRPSCFIPTLGDSGHLTTVRN